MTSTVTIQERQSKVTRWLLIPGIVWMSLFLVVPIAMIVYVSFWTQTTFTITSDPTLASWKQFFTSDTYTGSLWTTIRIWLIVLATVVLPAPGGAASTAALPAARAAFNGSRTACIGSITQGSRRWTPLHESVVRRSPFGNRVASAPPRR